MRRLCCNREHVEMLRKVIRELRSDIAADEQFLEGGNERAVDVQADRWLVQLTVDI